MKSKMLQIRLSYHKPLGNFSVCFIRFLYLTNNLCSLPAPLILLLCTNCQLGISGQLMQHDIGRHQCFYVEDVNLALNHSLSIFGILFILYSHTSQSSFSTGFCHQQMWFPFRVSEQQQSDTDKTSLKAQHMQWSISLSDNLF